MTDEDYAGKFLPMVKGVNEGIKEEKRKKDEAEELQRQQVENQRKENERLQKELEAQQESLRKQQEAIDEAKNKALEERTHSRIKALESLGFTFSHSRQAFEFENLFVDLGDLKEATDEHFNKTITQLTKDTNTLKLAATERELEEKKKQQAETERKHRTELRLQELKDRFRMEIGPIFENDDETHIVGSSEFDIINDIWCSLSDVKNAEPDTWQSMIRSISQQYKDVLAQEETIRKQVEAQKEQERLKTLSDVQKVSEYLDKISEVACAKIENAMIKNIYDNLQDAIEQAKTSLQNIK
jgi:hypothetical protein